MRNEDYPFSRDLVSSNLASIWLLPRRESELQSCRLQVRRSEERRKKDVSSSTQQPTSVLIIHTFLYFNGMDSKVQNGIRESVCHLARALQKMRRFENPDLNSLSSYFLTRILQIEAVICYASSDILDDHLSYLTMMRFRLYFALILALLAYLTASLNQHQEQGVDLEESRQQRNEEETQRPIILEGSTRVRGGGNDKDATEKRRRSIVGAGKEDPVDTDGRKLDSLYPTSGNVYMWAVGGTGLRTMTASMGEWLPSIR